MNIFMTSDCPIECAKALDNRRVPKMILESAQMLSTAVGGPYKATHINHPCTVWVRESVANAQWLIDHMEALCQVYTYRSNGKHHKCESLIDYFREEVIDKLPGIGLTPPPNCTAYKEEKNIFIAYQLHLNDKWDREYPSWGPFKSAKKGR